MSSQAAPAFIQIVATSATSINALGQPIMVWELFGLTKGGQVYQRVGATQRWHLLDDTIPEAPSRIVT